VGLEAGPDDMEKLKMVHSVFNSSGWLGNLTGNNFFRNLVLIILLSFTQFIPIFLDLFSLLKLCILILHVTQFRTQNRDLCKYTKTTTAREYDIHIYSDNHTYVVIYRLLLCIYNTVYA
jgi:hypothetical protein